MAEHTVPAIETSVHKTYAWLKELSEIGHFEGNAQAYSALRAVLHALRDRLTADEATNLAAQLPMVVRGFYFEGWRPSAVPIKERTRQEFLERVEGSLRLNTTIDSNVATRATFDLLQRKVTSGEIEDVQAMMPPELREFWPEKARV